MIAQFSRYVGVQLAAYAIDMGVFLLLSRWLPPLAANVVAKVAAGALAFVLHRRLTFAGRAHGAAAPQLLRYGLLLLANVPIASLALWALLPWLAPPALAKFVADVACVVLTFALSRQLVFTAPRARPPRDGAA
jgi:putative flippase GtrA